MATTPSAYEKVPDRKLTLTQRLCKQGRHRLESGLTGMWHRCTRQGCGYRWELD